MAPGMALATFEVEPTAPQRGSVLWLHGLGASHHDFVPVVRELDLPYLRFVFPSAPVRPFTLSRGMRMPAWYDIESLGVLAPHENARHLAESTRELGALLAREQTRGVAYENIALAGFSQGGAMALHAGLRSERRLAGIIAISGYLPAAHALEAEARAERRDTPILICHGRYDRVVPHAGGHASFKRLERAGFSVTWAEFDVEHTMDLDEVKFIKHWLAARFPMHGDV